VPVLVTEIFTSKKRFWGGANIEAFAQLIPPGAFHCHVGKRANGNPFPHFILHIGTLLLLAASQQQRQSKQNHWLKNGHYPQMYPFPAKKSMNQSTADDPFTHGVQHDFGCIMQAKFLHQVGPVRFHRIGT